MEEIWRDVRDYIGLYQVSNYGRVKSLERDVDCGNQYGRFVRHYEEQILNPIEVKRSGHLVVYLSKGYKKDYKKYVHDLVAQAFIPNPNNYDIVHHKDHNPRNNHVENLEWMSDAEHKAHHHSKTVYQHTKDGLLVNVWKSASEEARVLGFKQSAISACCNNNYSRESNNVYKDYIWSYTPLA